MLFRHFLRPPFVTNAKTAFVTACGDDRVKDSNRLKFPVVSSLILVLICMVRFFFKVKFWIIYIVVSVFPLSVWIFYSYVLKMFLERFLIKINIIWTHEKKTLKKLIGTSCYIRMYILFTCTMRFRISVLSLNNSTKYTLFILKGAARFLFWIAHWTFLTWWKEWFIVQNLPYGSNINNIITIVWFFFTFMFSWK